MCDHVESVKKDGHCAICEQDENCSGCRIITVPARLFSP